MKRYIKEMANDIQRDIQKEIDSLKIPFGELAELGKSVNTIIRLTECGCMTNLGAVRGLTETWEKLAELKYEGREKS